MKKQTLLVITLFFASAAACAHGLFFSQWQARTSRTQSKQSGWSVPVVKPYAALIQVARTDFARQTTAPPQLSVDPCMPYNEIA
jgi:hypothetical protein